MIVELLAWLGKLLQSNTYFHHATATQKYRLHPQWEQWFFDVAFQFTNTDFTNFRKVSSYQCWYDLTDETVSILKSKLQKNFGPIADFAICSYNIIIKYKKEMALPQCHASFFRSRLKRIKWRKSILSTVKPNVSQNSSVKNSLLQGSQLYITSDSKKLGQSTVLYHYYGLSQFFWNRH